MVLSAVVVLHEDLDATVSRERPSSPHIATVQIQDGGEASGILASYCDGSLPQDEWDKVRDDLLAYCELDTFGTVELLRVLREVV